MNKPTHRMNHPKHQRPNPPQTGPSQKGASAGPNINPASPAESGNIYQEGNMTTSGSNPEHRPDSAISNMLPGGTTQSGETAGE